MANWNNGANNGMADLKAATNASDAEMSGLRVAIQNWAANNPNSRQQFPFAPLRHRNHHVTATTNGGWIDNVTYGDN